MTARVRAYFSNISDRHVMLILIGIAVFVVGFSLGAHYKSGTANLWAWADSFFQNFGTEMFGAFLTFLLIEVLVSGRRERETRARERRERKEALILQMGSTDNVTALNAARQLQAGGWLGSLQGAYLRGANLRGADLAGANLYSADMLGINLRGGDLFSTDLQSANLRSADLADANLEEANLSNTNLLYANMRGARLGGSQVDENTKLPDGTNWTTDTDMGRFTNPTHPEYKAYPSYEEFREL